MAAALVPLQNITLGSTVTSVTFGSIPTSGFRDLRIVASIVYTGSGQGYSALRFNGDTGANYNRVQMNGNGSAAQSNAIANETVAYLHNSSNDTNPTQITVDIMDYSATDKHKLSLSRGNSASAQVSAIAGRWASTSAITSVTFLANLTGALPTGSTIALYGVVA